MNKGEKQNEFQSCRQPMRHHQLRMPHWGRNLDMESSDPKIVSSGRCVCSRTALRLTLLRLLRMLPASLLLSD